MSIRRTAWAVLFLLSLQLAANLATAEDARVATVGMAARINDLVLPGSELEVIAANDRRVPIVVRILNVTPHGSAHRYDLLYYGLEPGTHDLRKYFRRKDGSSTGELPPIPVTIETILPAGQILPHELETKPVSLLGGYRRALWIGGILWVLCLLAILFVRRPRKVGTVEGEVHEPTLADRLQPLVEDGMKGRLSPARCAELERILLAYWRQRLHLDSSRPVESFAALRAHPDAGPLLTQLERWLHQPGVSTPVDVAELLRPYKGLAANTIALPAEGAHA